MTTLTLKSALSFETREKLLKLPKPFLTVEGPDRTLKTGKVVGQVGVHNTLKIPKSPEEVAALEREQKQVSYQNFLSAKKWLESAYPNAIDFANPKPLKINIHKDIVAVQSPISPRQRVKALKAYVYSVGYLKAFIDGQWRHDLQGGPVGQITVAEKEFAALKLVQKTKKFNDKKKHFKKKQETPQ